MMKRLLLFLIALFFLPSLAEAQTQSNQVNKIPHCIVSELSTGCYGGGDAGREAWIVDGLHEFDCTLGGGSYKHVCRQESDGTSVPAVGPQIILIARKHLNDADLTDAGANPLPQCAAFGAPSSVGAGPCGTGGGTEFSTFFNPVDMELVITEMVVRLNQSLHPTNADCLVTLVIDDNVTAVGAPVAPEPGVLDVGDGSDIDVVGDIGTILFANSVVNHPLGFFHVVINEDPGETCTSLVGFNLFVFGYWRRN